MRSKRAKDFQDDKAGDRELSRAYLHAFLGKQLLKNIKEKDKNYHDSLYNKIIKRKGNARINTKKLSQMNVGLDQAIFLTGAYDVVTHPDFSMRIIVEEHH